MLNDKQLKKLNKLGKLYKDSYDRSWIDQNCEHISCFNQASKIIKKALRVEKLNTSALAYVFELFYSESVWFPNVEQNKLYKGAKKEFIYTIEKLGLKYNTIDYGKDGTDYKLII